MTYRVEHDSEPRPPAGDYRYRIYRGDRLVARYQHDFRGDEHALEFLDGTVEDWPVGRMIDFLHGGGPEPLVLSPAAEALLDRRAE